MPTKNTYQTVDVCSLILQRMERRISYLQGSLMDLRDEIYSLRNIIDLLHNYQSAGPQKTEQTK